MWETALDKINNYKNWSGKFVEQCGGLPLAIATIGSSMKGEDDICEWRNALKELEERMKSVKGSDIEILEKLKFSYDRLKDYPNIQNCFLYCSLYPEDYLIKIGELIESWIDEGLLDDLETRQAMHDRGHSILNKLVNNCLLERYDAFRDMTKLMDERVKMHDVLRDMSLNIKRGDCFMEKAGAQLKEVPGEREWKRSLEKVSLMKNSRLDIPPRLSPKCPHLKTLLLQRCDQVKCLSESFFMHMPALKVLNLSFTRTANLPNSISLLKNLGALILVGCKQLTFVPSLAELRALRKLNLLGSNIKEVPQGIEVLENLTYLRLGSRYLKEFPVGLISPRICHLQYLAVMGMHLRGEEAAKLRKLEILVCSFCDFQEFEKYVRLIQGKFPTNFCIFVGSSLSMNSWLGNMLDFKNPRKHLAFRNCEMEKIDDRMVLKGLISLDVGMCDNLKCLNKNPLFHKVKGLKNCKVYNCEGMECVVDLSLSSSSCSCSAVQGMEVLTLSSLRNLNEFLRVSVECPTPRVITIFTSLRELSLLQCPKIEMLFPVELLQGLQNLEKIEVFNCEKMEKVFGDENIHKGKEGTTTILPKLKSLGLHELPKLKRICSVGIMIRADHLQFLHIADCPQLKRIPLSLPLSENGEPSPPPFLKLIHAWPKEWWESVELDDPSPSARGVLSRSVSAKDVLSRSVSYSQC